MTAVLEPRELIRGDSTAEPGVVEYRLGILRSLTHVSGRWLDCGCAEGSYSDGLRRIGADAVVGTDVEADRVAEARSRHAAVSGLSFLTAAAEDLPFEDASFHGALLNEVLEHVADQALSLAELRRVLVPGGTLAVFSPNRWFPFEGHGAVIGPLRLPFPVPFLPWLPQRLAWRAMTARNYWPGQLAGIVADAGFEVRAVDFALPLFTKYPWLPRRARESYARWLPRLQASRAVRRFGVSTLVLARKPGDAAGPRGCG